ncbi:MAG: bifunctional precorrin-2 dehydrogenase/sirohydrochlorin ferrochelatase [Candidatus Bathyarchaeota archaeon]|nr:bifunctional precorrin-2 dehydrogenase/sirohydrochlorin ferrochelatase [Candidatus Bathyarchaeum sp.]
MLILDFNLNGKYVVIVGGGSEAYRKILSFLDAGSKILVASKKFLLDIHTLNQLQKIDLLQTDIKDIPDFVNSLGNSPDILVAVTNDSDLNFRLVKHAKDAGCLVYCVDNPEISDFMFPALAKVGDVNIAVSTSGKSPSMARVLRQRIEKMVTPEDLLQIRLQDCIRPLLKQQISEQKIRKIVLSEILDDNHIKKLLKQSKFEAAKQFALDIAESFKEKNQALSEA